MEDAPATGNFRAAVNCRSLVPFQNSSLSSSPSPLRPLLAPSPPFSPSTLLPLAPRTLARPELPTFGHELIFERGLRVVNIATGPQKYSRGAARPANWIVLVLLPLGTARRNTGSCAIHQSPPIDFTKVWSNNAWFLDDNVFNFTQLCQISHPSLKTINPHFWSDYFVHYNVPISVLQLGDVF